MLGDDILVAPVLEEGKDARNIYLPAGKWIDQNNGETYIGPLWLNDYPAPIEVLPYFIKSGSQRVIAVNNLPFVVLGFLISKFI